MEEQIAQLHKRITDLEIKLLQLSDTKLNNSRSTDLKELFAALAKAQAEMNTAGLSNTNPFFKSRYADLAEIVKASRPALTKYGLSVIQQIMPNDDGQSILHTILSHSSGQWIETRMRITPPKPDVQTLGSYITYIRRYSYAALVGVVVCDEDDDGEIAVATERTATIKGTSPNTYKAKDQSYDVITKEQLEELNYELNGYPDIAEMVLEKLHLQSLADMPKNQYSISIRRIREIKQLRESTQP